MYKIKMGTTKELGYFHVLLLFIIIVGAERTKDKMYERINTTAACFRRLNATHQTGCTSERGGSTGIIHVINSSSDITFLLKNGEAGPYVIVLPVTLLTDDTLKQFSTRPDLISGAIAHINTTRPQHWTLDDQCPNKLSSIPDSCRENATWNPFGTGLLHIDWPFPVFLVREETELAKIVGCFRKFNDFDYDGQPLRSLCALELDSHMLAAVDAPTCLRRGDAWSVFSRQQYCEPLGDRNVWSSLIPHANDSATLPVVLVVARTDTTSLFNEVMPGGDSAVSSLVTLLAVARQMYRLKNTTDVKDYRMNVWFMVLNGEAYDYIGSQRLVWDITNGRFPPLLPPLTMDKIGLILELSQFGKASNLYAHRFENNNGIVQRFLQTLKSAGLTVTDVPTKNRFPPSSIQTFLKQRPDIPNVLLTEYSTEFSNTYYNSIYDDSVNINYVYHNGTPQIDTIQHRLATLADTLARGLHTFVTNSATPPALPDNNSGFYVDELMSCYLETASCRIHRVVGLRDPPEKTPPLSLYVGTADHNNLQTTLTAGALAWLTGDRVPRNQTFCRSNSTAEPFYQYIWMGDTIDAPENCTCFRTTMNMTAAVSPAFEIEDYPWSSGNYSTWAESGWYSLSVRMFLKPSARHEIATISIGTVTFVLSMALVYFVNSRSHILFPPPPDRTVTSSISG